MTDGYLSAKEVAKMMRKKLKVTFPGTKFSVRCDGHSSIDVRWTDGPTQKMVDKIVQPYAGGGFDGMIDMAYSVSAYLLADGYTMVYGSSSGTTGSAGVMPAYKEELPKGAQVVRPLNKYVFTRRNYSADFLRRGAESVARFWGYEAPIQISEWSDGSAHVDNDTRLPNAEEWFATLVHREMVKRVPASFVASV